MRIHEGSRLTFKTYCGTPYERGLCHYAGRIQRIASDEIVTGIDDHIGLSGVLFKFGFREASAYGGNADIRIHGEQSIPGRFNFKAVEIGSGMCHLSL